MRVIENGEMLQLTHPVVTTGTFDGLHLGHQKVIAKTMAIAKQCNGTPVVFTFWPHPRFVLKKGDFKLLNTFEEKKILFRNLGVKYVYYQLFTKEFANLSSEEYVKNILVDKIGVKTLVVGYDHQFGKEHRGRFDILSTLAQQYNFDLIKVDALNINGLKVSSTNIRSALKSGNILRANKMLGYDYFISGTVNQGFKMGKKIGFPTANLDLPSNLKMLPANGVYAVYAKIENEFFTGMLNIGYRPTFKNQPRVKSIEVHLFKFSKDIYNVPINIYFINRLRDEIKFNQPDELIKQLYIDMENSKKMLNSLPKMPDSLI